MTEQEIVTKFAELLETGAQYGTEANRLIEEYAATMGTSEYAADLDLHAAAEDLLDEKAY